MKKIEWKQAWTSIRAKTRRRRVTDDIYPLFYRAHKEGRINDETAAECLYRRISAYEHDECILLFSSWIHNGRSVMSREYGALRSRRKLGWTFKPIYHRVFDDNGRCVKGAVSRSVTSKYTRPLPSPLS